MFPGFVVKMEEDYDDIETIEDFSEPFDNLKKHAQKVVNLFKNWRLEKPTDDKIILYKLDISKGPARIPVTIEIVKKDVLRINYYAEDIKLAFENINQLIGIQIQKFSCSNIEQILKFFEEHTLIKGDVSQSKVLNEKEKSQNLALFFAKNIDLCKQLLEAREARTNFIHSDKTLQDCSQVILVNSEGQTSSMVQIKPGNLIQSCDLTEIESSSSTEESKNKRPRPSILRSKIQKVVKR
uniref:CSON015423 protein n=1 Tax=Culicoides sonorensis TaxID=179676 RepID=A0A336LPG6_CULSO